MNQYCELRRGGQAQGQGEDEVSIQSSNSSELLENSSGGDMSDLTTTIDLNMSSGGETPILMSYDNSFVVDEAESNNQNNNNASKSLKEVQVLLPPEFKDEEGYSVRGMSGHKRLTTDFAELEQSMYKRMKLTTA